MDEKTKFQLQQLQKAKEKNPDAEPEKENEKIGKRLPHGVKIIVTNHGNGRTKELE